jgi:alanine racemase
VTDIPDVKAGDEVVLLGAQGNERITAEQLAQWAGTINYELTTQIQTSVPRIAV